MRLLCLLLLLVRVFKEEILRGVKCKKGIHFVIYPMVELGIFYLLVLYLREVISHNDKHFGSLA